MGGTEAGRTALSYADEIFTLGEEIEGVLYSPAEGRLLQFRVGVADAVPKGFAYELLEPAVRRQGSLRMPCREGKFDSLLADLAVHRLDIVIADGPMTGTLNVKEFNRLLGECDGTFYATTKLARTLKILFPRSMNGAPCSGLAKMRRFVQDWCAGSKRMAFIRTSSASSMAEPCG